MNGFDLRPIRSLVVTRQRSANQRVNSEIWNLNLDQIEPHTGRVLSKVYIDSSKLGPSTYLFAPKTVLYSKLRPYLNKVIVAYESGAATTELVPLICKESEVIPEYLAYFLRSNKFLTFASNVVSGAKMPRMVMSEFWNYKAPIPSIPEQRRIVAILDQAKALLEKRQQSLAQVDGLEQAIFYAMFGDPIKNSMRWPLRRLGEVGTLDRGVSKHRPRNAPELLGGPYPLIQTGDIANCDGYIRSYQSTYTDFGLKQSKLWPAGTLCITIAANIAKTGILTFAACFPDSVVGFRSGQQSTIEYVRVLLSFMQKRLEDFAPESAQKNINLAILRALDIPFPPIKRQETFARYINELGKLKASYRSSLTELDALFASLQHRAFRGEL